MVFMIGGVSALDIKKIAQKFINVDVGCLIFLGCLDCVKELYWAHGRTKISIRDRHELTWVIWGQG